MTQKVYINVFYKQFKELHDLLLNMKKTKEEYIVEGKEYLEDEEYEIFKSKYLEILSKAKEEKKIYLLISIKEKKLI